MDFLGGDVRGPVRRLDELPGEGDIEIAVAAVTADARLWSRDSDFDRIGAVLPELARFTP